MHRWKAVELWQYAAALSLILLAGLAVVGAWPFDTVVEVADDPTIVELAFGDRLTIGLIRTVVLAVAGYVVVSVPALVLERRWMQGVTTTGLMADAHRSERWKDDFKDLAELLRSVTKTSDPVATLSQVLGFDDDDEPGEGADD